MLKPSVVCPDVISLIALMLHSFTPNHWFKFEKFVSLFEKIIFLYLKVNKKELGYPKEQYSLIVMCTFKGQDNAEIKELCSKNDCELVIVPHNLTIKLQPLEITTKQKVFISNKFNTWYGDRANNQLKRGVAPVNVKLSLKMSDIKPLHALWIVEMHGYLK